MNIYNLYDNIIRVTYTNLAIDAVNNKGIYFNNFNQSSFCHRVFLKVAFMVADFEHTKIFLNCNRFFDFLKILYNNYSIKDILKGKCILRYKRHKNALYTDIDVIANFEAKEFQVNIDIFEKIWKKYYRKENK